MNANVVAKCVATSVNKDLTEMLVKVGQSVGEPRAEGNIEICHRVNVPNSTTNKNVVVTRPQS